MTKTCPICREQFEEFQTNADIETHLEYAHHIKQKSGSACVTCGKKLTCFFSGSPYSTCEGYEEEV